MAGYRSPLPTCTLACSCQRLLTTTVLLVGEKGCDPYRRQQINWMVGGEPRRICVKHSSLHHEATTVLSISI